MQNEWELSPILFFPHYTVHDSAHLKYALKPRRVFGSGSWIGMHCKITQLDLLLSENVRKVRNNICLWTTLPPISRFLPHKWIMWWNVAANKCIKTFRCDQEVQLLFRLNVRMGKKCHLSYYDRINDCWCQTWWFDNLRNCWSEEKGWTCRS